MTPLDDPSIGRSRVNHDDSPSSGRFDSITNQTGAVVLTDDEWRIHLNRLDEAFGPTLVTRALDALVRVAEGLSPVEWAQALEDQDDAPHPETLERLATLAAPLIGLHPETGRARVEFEGLTRILTHRGIPKPGEPQSQALEHRLAAILENDSDPSRRAEAIPLRLRNGDVEGLLRLLSNLDVFTAAIDQPHHWPNLLDAWRDLEAVHQLDAAATATRLVNAWRQAVPPPPSDAVARGLHDLAHLFHRQGRLDQGELYYRHALQAREMIHGPAHPCIAQNLNNLAGLLLAQNRHPEAEACYRKAIEVADLVLGTEHPNTIQTRVNLAVMYRDLGDAAQAAPIFAEVLEARRRLLGPHHPEVALAHHNLGVMLRDLGQLEAAFNHLQNGLTLRQAAWDQGESIHPLSLAASHHELGTTYNALGRPDRAEFHLRQALTLRRDHLGFNHLKPAETLNELSLALHELGRIDEAETLAREALAIRERLLDPRDPELATSLNNLAELLRVQNKFDEAEPLYRRALAIDELTYGMRSPHAAVGLNNLGLLLMTLNRLDEAEATLRQAWADSRDSLGSDHLQTATCADHLAEVLRLLNRPDEAANLLRQALFTRERHLGNSHELTNQTRRSLEQVEAQLQAASKPFPSTFPPSSVSTPDADDPPPASSATPVSPPSAALETTTAHAAEADPIIVPDHADTAVGAIDPTPSQEGAEPSSPVPMTNQSEIDGPTPTSDTPTADASPIPVSQLVEGSAWVDSNEEPTRIQMSDDQPIETPLMSSNPDASFEEREPVAGLEVPPRPVASDTPSNPTNEQEQSQREPSAHHAIEETPRAVIAPESHSLDPAAFPSPATTDQRPPFEVEITPSDWNDAPAPLEVVAAEKSSNTAGQAVQESKATEASIQAEEPPSSVADRLDMPAEIVQAEPSEPTTPRSLVSTNAQAGTQTTEPVAATQPREAVESESDHLAVGRRWMEQAARAMSLGDLHSAERDFRTALDLFKSRLGQRHPATIDARHQLIALIFQRGGLDDLEPLLHEALETAREVEGPNHPNMVIHLKNLAGLEAKRGRIASARDLFTQAMELERTLFGANDPRVAQTRAILEALGGGESSPSTSTSTSPAYAKRGWFGGRR